MVTLIALPSDVLVPIFKLLEDKELLLMRKVCKGAQEMAEATVLNRTQTLSIGHLKIVKEIKDKVLISFSFDRLDVPDRLPSKLIIVSALNYLKTSAFRLSPYEKYSEQLLATMTSKATDAFFNRLTALLGSANCTALEIYPSKFETFSFVSKFIQTSSELHFTVDDSDKSRDLLLQLVDKLQSTSVRLNLISSAKSSVKANWTFLERLAEAVDAIALSAPSNYWYTQSTALSATTRCLEWPRDELLVRRLNKLSCRILEKRCSYLDLSDARVCLSIACLDRLLNTIRGKPFYFAVEAYATIHTTDDYNDFFHRRHLHDVRIVKDNKKPGRKLVEITKNGMNRRQW